ncbi:hypothetical protein JTB14_028784 [Gonioctena quinquepunctata]|nr:hypothetical protein JTB14_028784 [Gonioctena quinquepunctata]
MSIKEKKLKLPSGDLMPLVGFGTWMVKGSESTLNILDMALEAGYRLFDTATMYDNETDIGKALKKLLPKHNLSRKDIFITTKLYPSDHGKADEAIKASLKKLDCDYIDLYLIHWPGTYNQKDNNANMRSKSWKQMVEAVKAGSVRNIGVSNYTVRHLKELLDKDFGIRPAVNQVEWHPFCYQKKLYDFCQKEGIVLQAYQSLGGPGNRDLLDNKQINEIAQKLEKSPAQVILRWAVQQNVAIIPKSKTKEYIFRNRELDFTIPDEHMEVMSSFKQMKYDWDPETVS